MNIDNSFSNVFSNYNPKDLGSHNILRFFVEDLTENEKVKFVNALFCHESWVLPTEICKFSDSIKLKKFTNESFLNIFKDWATSRILFSNSLNGEIKNYFIPSDLIKKYLEALFSIRNLNFPEESMLIFKSLLTDSYPKYLNKYFEASFWNIIEDFSVDEIEVFFGYYANAYIEEKESNIGIFIYYFLNELAYSSKIFSLSTDFIDLLRLLSNSLLENNSNNEYTTLLSVLLIELIDKKELDLSDFKFGEVIKETLDSRNVGDFENLDLFRFLDRFNYPFNDFDFDLDIKTLFEKIRININLANSNDIKKKCALVHHHIMSADDYCDLFYFYLEHYDSQHIIQYFIEFVKLIDELRLSFSSLLWFDEYLNFDAIDGKIVDIVKDGYSVEINKEIIRKKLRDKKLPIYSTYENLSQYEYGFLNKKYLKDFPKSSNYYSSNKLNNSKKSDEILQKAIVGSSELFFIIKANYSTSNQGFVASLFPFNNATKEIISKFELKRLFTSIELILIEKSHEFLGLETSFLQKITILNKNKYFQKEYKINFVESDFWKLFAELRPSLYEKIFIHHQKSESGFINALHAFESQQIITGKVLRQVKGGFTVDIFGKEAFLPGSHVDNKIVTDYYNYIGKSLEFKVIKIDNIFKNIVVSHKAIIEEQNLINKRESLEKLERGGILRGNVKNITNYGVFVDLGGFDGLIHISDVSWGRIKHIEEIIRIGDKIDVVVLDFDDDKKRISLGYKQLSTNPWDSTSFVYKVGDIVNGYIVDIQPYGVFLEVESGIEGLVHISEICNDIPECCDINELVKIGDIASAIIQKIDFNERKMLLSMKQLLPDPWIEKYSNGSIHRATIIKFNNAGIIVRLENGPEGIIRKSKNKRRLINKRLFDLLEIGKSLNVKVISRNLSIRKLELELIND